MALEDEIKALTAAIKEQTARLEAIASTGGKTATAADKPAAGKPAAGKPAAAKPKAPAKPKGTSPEDFVKRFGQFLQAGDADDRENAKVCVKAIVDYFGSAKVSEISADNYEEALGYLTQYENGETPDFDGGGEEEDGGSLL